MITDAVLKGLCAQAANMAKTDYRYRHQINGVLAVYFEGSGLRRLRSLERDAEEHVGKAWLNSPTAKEIIFGALCGGATEIPPDAIVVSTAVDRYLQTPAFDALTPDEMERIARAGHPRDWPQYFRPEDALMATAQSAERVCISTQRFEHGLLIGEPEYRFVDQSKFGGRLKFYGKEPSREVREAIGRLKRRAT